MLAIVRFVQPTANVCVRVQWPQREVQKVVKRVRKGNGNPAYRCTRVAIKVLR